MFCMLIFDRKILLKKFRTFKFSDAKNFGRYYFRMQKISDEIIFRPFECPKFITSGIF